MMIQVNLLPRPSAGASRAGTRALAAWGARLRGSVGDPYLVSAVGGVVAAAAVVGALWTGTHREAAALAERTEVALADSTRHATAIAVRARAIAERDSVRRQLAVITAIDSTRYVWAHVLDEVGRALPPYTWLTAVQQTSAPPVPAAAPVAPTKDAPAAAAAAAAGSGAGDSTSVRRPVTFRIVGQTVDIQALTLFMRDLEASPFVQNVQLARSEAVQADGKDVTEFTLDGEFQPAPVELLRTQVLAVPVSR